MAYTNSLKEFIEEIGFSAFHVVDKMDKRRLRSIAAEQPSLSDRSLDSWIETLDLVRLVADDVCNGLGKGSFEDIEIFSMAIANWPFREVSKLAEYRGTTVVDKLVEVVEKTAKPALRKELREAIEAARR